MNIKYFGIQSRVVLSQSSQEGECEPASQLLEEADSPLQVKTRLSYWWEYLQRLLASWRCTLFPKIQGCFTSSPEGGTKADMKLPKGARAMTTSIKPDAGAKLDPVTNWAPTRSRDSSLFETFTPLILAINSATQVVYLLLLHRGERGQKGISSGNHQVLNRNGGARRQHLDEIKPEQPSGNSNISTA